MISGGVQCWGHDRAPVLGREPRAGIAVDVEAGLGYICSVTTTALQCWGVSRALGDGTNTNSNTPVDVLGLSPKASDSDGDEKCARRRLVREALGPALIVHRFHLSQIARPTHPPPLRVGLADRTLDQAARGDHETANSNAASF